MTASEPVQLATFIVTIGAVAFALAIAIWAFRLTAGARQAQRQWRARLTQLEDDAHRFESVFSAHPGLVFVWQSPPGEQAVDWGKPKVHGSSAALASMMAFAELGQDRNLGADIAADILNSLSDFEARSPAGEETTLRQCLRAMVETGANFSITITAPSGRFIEVDGRAAGRQLVLWINDTTVRSIAETSAHGKIEKARRTVGEDPLAFLDMLERSPSPAWRMNASGRIVWVNQAYVRAVEAKDCEDVVQRQILLEPGLADQAQAALNSGAVKTSVRGAVSHGARRVMSFAVYPINGGAAGLAVDTTEGEEAKAALKRFRQAHDETLNHMAESVAIFDRARRLVFYNRAFVNLFGLEEAFLNDRPTHGVLLDKMRERRRLPEQLDYAHWRESELSHYESAPGTDAPDELWTIADGRTLRVARQRHPLGGLLLIFEDMTDQLALQARYNTQLKVQRATLDKLHESVAVFGSNGRLQLHNAAFEEIWRLDPQTLDNAPFDELAVKCSVLYPDETAWSELKARITDPSPQSRQPTTGEIKRVDGSVLTFVTRPLPDGATLVAWDDITDSRRIEAALRDRAEALEASERIKTEFVEHVSYQLRTPLTTIHGYADLIAGGFAGELSDRQGEYMTAIQSASGQLGKLIDDILDIAAIDAGQLELDISPLDLKPVCENAADLIASRASHAGVKLVITVEDEDLKARVDAARIKQVLYNLLTNALDHVEAGGMVELGAVAEGEELVLWVADDGAGIAPDRQAKIFERFERGDGGGAGLGLALVNDIIRLHGGWVALESAPGEGTRVTCHIPIRQPKDTDELPDIGLTAIPQAGQ